MTGTPRDRARARTMEEIKRIGRAHLASEGAAALSLRAVARDLGVVSSAVYRYVASRDDLLTLLVVDGYDELGDAVDAALAAVPDDAFREQFLVIGRSVRTWALREPATYALLFGSPVPGYQAPGELTTQPGTRVIRALIEVWEGAWAAGKLVVPPTHPLAGRLSTDVEAIRREYRIEAPAEAVTRGVLAWAGLFGCVSFELFGQYGPDTFGDPESLFEHHLGVLADSIALVA